MSSRRWFRFALFATALVVLVPHAVSAATSLRAGWWTSTAIAIAPDAPPGSLVVQGGVTFEHPSSYAAIEVALEPGETAIELHLTVVEGSASSPNTTLALCPLTESFSPAEGGSTKDGPEFDCGEQVEASPSKDGATYDIDVSGLGRDDGLALAILPTMPTDRVVLEPPTIADITTVGDEGSSEPGSALDNSPPAPSSEARPTTTMPAQSPDRKSVV